MAKAKPFIKWVGGKGQLIEQLDKDLKNKFKEVWQKVVPVGSPFKCEYRNPFTYMDSEP